MKLKYIKRATELFQQVEKLDAEIIKVEKVLESVVKDQASAKLKLTFKGETKDLPVVDEEGDLLHPIRIAIQQLQDGFRIYPSGCVPAPSNTNSYETEIDDATILYILSFHHQRLKLKRHELLTGIQKLGIKL